MPKMASFSTHLLDQVLAERRAVHEALRQEVLRRTLGALEELADHVPFSEAYLFGSVIQPYRFTPDSDVDVAFVGLNDEYFFQAMVFLTERLGRDVDVVQLERVPFAERIKKEGLRWSKRS